MLQSCFSRSSGDGDREHPKLEEKPKKRKNGQSKGQTEKRSMY